MKRTLDSTDAVHAGEPRTKAFDGIPQPIVQTATYTFADSDELIRYTQGTHENPDRGEYGRYGNPTARAVEERLAAFEATEDALLFGSGMSAIATTILALVKQGQHVVLFKDCYRMTRTLVEQLSGFGVSSTLLDAGDLAGLSAALRPETRLVVSESPTNPYLSCIDLEALVATCKGRRGLKVAIDSTFATPFNCRPASFGVDLVLHSCTKYFAGHHDVLAGAVCGSRALVSVIRDLRGVLGTVCDPHAAFLVARGMKTLALRVEKQNATGLLVARFLETQKRVKKVFYPGLPSHADHAIAAKQMKGFGGVVSFIVKGGLEGAKKVVDSARLARIAPSFGGVDTLIEQPALMSFYEMTSEERAAIGIDDGLIRLSVGIEEPDAIIADLRFD